MKTLWSLSEAISFIVGFIFSVILYLGIKSYNLDVQIFSDEIYASSAFNYIPVVETCANPTNNWCVLEAGRYLDILIFQFIFILTLNLLMFLIDRCFSSPFFNVLTLDNFKTTSGADFTKYLHYQIALSLVCIGCLFCFPGSYIFEVEIPHRNLVNILFEMMGNYWFLFNVFFVSGAAIFFFRLIYAAWFMPKNMSQKQ